MHGVETIGSAELSTNVEEMKRCFIILVMEDMRIFYFLILQRESGAELRSFLSLISLSVVGVELVLG